MSTHFLRISDKLELYFLTEFKSISRDIYPKSRLDKNQIFRTYLDFLKYDCAIKIPLIVTDINGNIEHKDLTGVEKLKFFEKLKNNNFQLIYDLLAFERDRSKQNRTNHITY